MRKLIKSFSFLFLLFTSINVYADTYVSTGASLYTGNSTDIIVKLETDSKPLAAGGTVGSSDNSCIKINSVSGFANVSVNGLKFAYAPNGNEISNGTSIIKVNITGLKACSASLIITNAETANISGDHSAKVKLGTINVTNPPSSNNNLASLNVGAGSLSPSFNANTTSYNVEVDNNVSSINISATAADSGARIEGTGTKSLNYGYNSLTVKVIAASGDVKTYTINVNRKDNRSGNNNLASLSIENGTLNGTFDSGNTSYTGKVPYEVETVNIKAIPQDDKSSVTVSGNTGLISEETRNVSVTVTAENGVSKTYTIAVTRGKDPNKKLSNDNYLTQIIPSIGILSPEFDKEKTNYVIYLPYEVDSISFNTALSDTKYGVLDVDAPDTLMPGISNVFKFNVTAEDESVRTYTVVVKRAVNPDAESSSNTYLKSITVSNGELLYENGKKVTYFNKDIKRYYYKQGTAFNYKVETDDPNATVVTIEDGTSIQFIVEAPNGEFSIYTLDLYGRYTNIFRYIIVYIVGILTGGFILFVINKKKSNPKEKIKKEENTEKKTKIIKKSKKAS